MLTRTLWGAYRPGVLGRYPSWGTRIPGGAGYRATISIVATKILPCGALKNILPTAAIRMGDGHVMHSSGDCEVEVPMGSRSIAHRLYVMDTEAFAFVLGTDFFVEHSQILSLTCKHPTSSRWTMVTAGNLYLWSSRSIRLAT